MNKKERKETKTILNRVNFIKKEIIRIFKAQEFQIESLKEENKQLRKSLEQVESDAIH